MTKRNEAPTAAASLAQAAATSQTSAATVTSTFAPSRTAAHYVQGRTISLGARKPRHTTAKAGEAAGSPKRRVVATGATADPVKDYLKQIGRVPLLTAAQEVDLSERIEAGLYAQHLLDTEGGTMDFKRRRQLKWAGPTARKPRTTC